MPTLLLSTWKLPAAEALGQAARRSGWTVFGLDRSSYPTIAERAVYYGGSDVVEQVAARFGLMLIEPSWDLLTRVPEVLRLRAVAYAQYDQLTPFPAPVFVKPADVRRKAFDAGLYQDVREARLEAELDPQMPVLLAEPVEWLEEHRCFILDGRIVATSPYLRFGRPAWQPFARGSEPWALPAGAQDVCERLISTPDQSLPPCYVVDVGLIHGRGWAVVEFNPTWCSSLLGCDPRSVLPAIERASVSRDAITSADEPWLTDEPPPSVSPELSELAPRRLAAHAGAMT
jgi:hypothetical protein